MEPPSQPMAINIFRAMTPTLAISWVGMSVFFVVLLAIGGLVYWLIQRQHISEIGVQEFVHRLEEGRFVDWMKIALLVSAICFMIGMWFFDVTLPIISQAPNGFRGLSHEKAIEQAQISREIERGNGFSTKVIRPAALWQLEQKGRDFPLERTPDTYHAPLSPFINAGVFKGMDALNRLFRSASGPMHFFSQFVYDETMTKKGVVYAYDKIIAFTQLVFFLLAVLVNYFTARRLFDERLAALGMGLLLLCQAFWDFAMSGLPQMLMLLLFSGGMHTLFRAIEEKCAGLSPRRWIVATGVLFSLLALTHGLTIWIFAGVIVFALIYFRPLGRDAGILLGIFLLFYGPWMARNYVVCGSPVGIGWYSGLAEVRASESQVMRSMELPLDDVTPRIYRRKIQAQILNQMGQIYNLLGKVLTAPIFFVALLHPFKRKETADFRWAILLLWIFAVFGMAVFGLTEKSGAHANDLHVLFIPLMSFYGLGFLLVMWTRLEIRGEFFRKCFLAAIYFISALPFLDNFLDMIGPPKGRVQWPPYIPPYIAIMAEWTKGNEIIMSDMPWGVAWYADRKSLWLPMTIKAFIQLNDYNQLKGQIVGMYLTPVSGNSAFISDITRGEYHEWAAFIIGIPDLREFPLHAKTQMPMDGECWYYSDRDRWSNREE
jgi:Dolichyl-phosphate-mannose-protein mannosyltransferase